MKLDKFLLEFYLINVRICHKQFRIERFKFLPAVIPNSYELPSWIIPLANNKWKVEIVISVWKVDDFAKWLYNSAKSVSRVLGIIARLNSFEFYVISGTGVINKFYNDIVIGVAYAYSFHRAFHFYLLIRCSK